MIHRSNGHFASRACCFTIKFYLFHTSLAVFPRLVLLPLCIFPLLCVTLWLFVPLCIPVVRSHIFILSILYLFWEFSISMEMFCIISAFLYRFKSLCISFVIIFSLSVSLWYFYPRVTLWSFGPFCLLCLTLCLLFASLCSFCMQLCNPAFVALHYFSYSAPFLARL